MTKKDYSKFNSAIYTVLKQVHPDGGMRKNTMSVLNKLIIHIAVEIIKEAIDLTIKEDKKTLTSREIQTAVRLTLPGQLAKHGVSEGTKAITVFTSSQYTKNTPRSKRARLVFPISRVENLIKKYLPKGFRLGGVASVYLAAVLEYLTAEILELSGNAARDDKLTRIKLRHLYLAIHNDYALHDLFKTLEADVTSGGVLPGIHASLLPVTRKGKKVAATRLHYTIK